MKITGALNRRCFLGQAGLASGCLLTGLIQPCEIFGQADDVKEDLKTIESAVKQMSAVGIKSPTTNQRSTHFQGAGDAPGGFIAQGLTLCERLLKDYRSHFESKGFKIDAPKLKMTVVALADHAQFVKFLEADLGPETAGIYELGDNWLVMFDNRADGGKANAARLNGFVLMHEAFHLITFNTGLLNREGDVPLAVSEGLATYAETRRADGKTPIGRVNAPRLSGLVDHQNQGGAWIALERLLSEDAVFEQADLEQAAYAQSWILIHQLMQTKASAAKLRAFLDAIRNRMDSKRRLDDARTHLGDLAKLDQELRKSSARMIRSLSR